MSNPPRTAIWLTIPNNCRMAGEFEVGDHQVPNIHFILGSVSDDAHLLFEREALERFVELAKRMLAIPPRGDSEAFPQTVLVADYGYEIREESRLSLCE